MARYDLPKGIHRVRRELLSGVRWHFYAWRGGPKFWIDQQKKPTDPKFFVAYAQAVERPKPRDYMTPAMVDDFLSSPEMPKGERTRQDYRKWALRFADAFKDDPAKLFEEPEARLEVNDWRQQWAHSPRQYDYAGTIVTRILNWAWKERGAIRQHHCDGFTKVYEVDRSDIVWTLADREAFAAVAPEWANRILVTACETGLRPGDLIKLTRQNVEATPKGRRLRVRTRKRSSLAHIPITPALAEVLDATPKGRLLILTNASGNRLTGHRASEGVRQWRDKADLSSDLRLQDARGTAATRLLNAGLSLAEITNHMGWSLRHAANVIEHYARVAPDETDSVLVKLVLAEGGAS